MKNDICITFDLLSNLSIITLSWMCLTFGFFHTANVIQSMWMCSFVVAEGKLRKPTKVEGRSEFLCNGGGQREYILLIFPYTVYVSHAINRMLLNSQRHFLLVYVACAIPNSYSTFLCLNLAVFHYVKLLLQDECL